MTRTPGSPGDLITGVVTGTVERDRYRPRDAGFLLLGTVAVAVAGLVIAVVATGLSLLAWSFLVAAGVAGLLTGVMRVALAEPGRRDCEVRRFCLVDKAGWPVDCLVRGATDGVELRPGDHLQVRGKRDRHGILRVRRILVTVTAVGTTPRPGMGYLLARTVNVLAGVFVAAVALLALFLYLDIV